MATISDVRANYGLRAVGTTTYPTGSGAVSLGIENQTVRLTDADVFYAIQALVVGSASDLVINTSTGDKTGSTAWTAGSAQVETATVVAASGATSNGNLAVVVSSAGMAGTPLTVNVPLTTTTHTTAALIAQAIVDALNANTVVAARFTATRSTAAVVLTRKPTATYTVGSASVPVYLVGDASEFTIPTALGVTGATSTTGAGAAAGVASAGCYVVGDGEDFEGNALAAINNEISSIVIKNENNDSAISISTASSITSFPLSGGDIFQVIASVAPGIPTEVFTIEPDDTALVTIVVAGVSS
jgi:hypothetical protein